MRVRALLTWFRDARGYTATSADHAVLRLLIAALVLVVELPSALWTTGMPDGLWMPPPGPAGALLGPPHPVAAWGLLVATSAAAALYGVGWRPRASALVLAAAGVTTSAITFSFGKIDHTMLLWVTPVVLELVAPPGSDDRRRGLARQVLALVVGAAVLTAALPKAAGGWLDPSASAVHGHLLRNIALHGRDLLLAPAASRVGAGWWWEVGDWSTVAVEAAGVVAWLRARWFKPWLLVMVAFHVGVLLTLNIAFTINVVVYGAFVPWTRVLPGPVLELVRRLAGWGSEQPALALVPATAAVAAIAVADRAIGPAVAGAAGVPEIALGSAIVAAGAAVAAAALWGHLRGVEQPARQGSSSARANP